MADRKLVGGLNGGESPAVDSTWGESKLDARKLRMQAGVVPTSRQAPVRFALSASEVGLLVLALREKASGDRAGADGLLKIGETREESASAQIARGRIAGELRGQAVKLDGWADAFEGESVTVEVRS